MSAIAFWSTKWTLDVATKLVKANLRLHNFEAIQDDMSIIYVVNHFTRLETFLLPYVLHKHTGKEIWSLAAAGLFHGRIGSYLRSMGAVSTKDPDRDKSIIRTLLSGEHPWIVFPEGSMIKDKKVIDQRHVFSVYSEGIRRPPHKGAAFLALRAEFFRHKLRCLSADGDCEALENVLARFNLTSAEPVLNRRTVIVPVNITYYPIRARDNILLRIARSMAKDLSPRAIEELSVEGTFLSEDTDIDFTLGEPIDVRTYLSAPEYAPIMACGENDVSVLEEDPASLFSEAARELVMRYMRAIYRNTTINYDHILATIIRYQAAKTFTERAYRNRVYQCVKRIRELGHYRLHPLLENTYRDVLYDEPTEKLDDFLSLGVTEGLLRKRGNIYYKNFDVQQGQIDFHSVRQKELTYVIANELEPLEDVTEIIKDVARAPRRRLARTIRTEVLEEDAQIYSDDYTRFCTDEPCKPEAVGRPFLLTPLLRIRGGIVLVHGYLAAPLEVRALAEFLHEHGYAVYGVRLKGHGTSPVDLARTTWEAWYESVNRGYAIIKTLTDNIILGGFSMGGGLALLAAARKRDKVAAAFAINAPLHLRNYAARLAPSLMTVNSLYSKVRHRDSQWEYVDNAPENGHINYTRNPVSGVHELGQAIGAMEAALPDIHVPTLIIQGSRDPVVNPDSGPHIFSKIGSPRKELAVLERDRHGIVNGEGSREVFDHVQRFIDSISEKRAEPLAELEPSNPDVA